MIARVASVFSEENASYVGFAEDVSGTSYAMFSITDAPDAQDRRLGLDGLHFEVNDQANGGYDLITRIIADAGGLTVHGRDPAKPLLRIDFAPDLEARDEAVRALGEIATRGGVAFEGAGR